MEGIKIILCLTKRIKIEYGSVPIEFEMLSTESNESLEKELEPSNESTEFDIEYAIYLPNKWPDRYYEKKAEFALCQN